MMDTAPSGWYYALNGERVGPRSLEEVRALVANGVLDADSLVWTDGMREWARVGDFAILSPEWVQPASAPAPRAEAEWTPSVAPAPLPGTAGAPRPWLRLGARLTDILVCVFVMAGVASAVPGLASRMPTDPTTIRVADQFLMTAALGVLVVLLEGLLLHLSGTTPGKSLFGVRVTTAEGGRLSLGPVVLAGGAGLGARDGGGAPDPHHPGADRRLLSPHLARPHPLGRGHGPARGARRDVRGDAPWRSRASSSCCC
jgi:hypothetical protein